MMVNCPLCGMDAAACAETGRPCEEAAAAGWRNWEVRDLRDPAERSFASVAIHHKRPIIVDTLAFAKAMQPHLPISLRGLARRIASAQYTEHFLPNALHGLARGIPPRAWRRLLEIWPDGDVPGVLTYEDYCDYIGERQPG